MSMNLLFCLNLNVFLPSRLFFSPWALPYLSAWAWIYLSGWAWRCLSVTVVVWIYVNLLLHSTCAWTPSQPDPYPIFLPVPESVSLSELDFLPDLCLSLSLYLSWVWTCFSVWAWISTQIWTCLSEFKPVSLSWNMSVYLSLNLCHCLNLSMFFVCAFLSQPELKCLYAWA